MNTEAGDIQVATGGEAKKRGRKARPSFDFSTAVASNGAQITLDENGKLTGVPTNWTPEFATLGKKDFTSADAGLYFEFKAFALNLQKAALDQKIEDCLEEAKIARTPLSDSEKKVRKMKRMQKALDKLAAELAADGIEV